MRNIYIFWIFFAALLGLGVGPCAGLPTKDAAPFVANVVPNTKSLDSKEINNSKELPKAEQQSGSSLCKMTFDQARAALKKKCLEDKENTSLACMNELTMLAEKSFKNHPACQSNSENGGVNHGVLMCIMNRESKKDKNGDFVSNDCDSKKIIHKNKNGIKRVTIQKSGGCGVVQMTGDGVTTAARAFDPNMDPAKSCIHDLQKELGEQPWGKDFMLSMPKGKERYLAQDRNSAIILQAAHVCTNIVERKAFTPCENGKYYYGHDPKDPKEVPKIKGYCEEIDSCTKDLSGAETSNHKKREEFALIRTSWLNELTKIAGPDCNFDNENLTLSLRTERTNNNKIQTAEDESKNVL